jgi:hypothetical protein
MERMYLLMGKQISIKPCINSKVRGLNKILNFRRKYEISPSYRYVVDLASNFYLGKPAISYLFQFSNT